MKRAPIMLDGEEAGVEKVSAEVVEQTLAEVAQGILSDPEYLKSLKDRAKTGRLTPTEARWVYEMGRAPSEKAKEPWKEMLDAATPDELAVIAKLIRRAKLSQKGDTRRKRKVS